MSVEKIAALSQIDPWWLKKLEHIKNIQDAISGFTLATLPRELMKEAKEAGLSDKQIAKRCKSTAVEVRVRTPSVVNVGLMCVCFLTCQTFFCAELFSYILFFRPLGCPQSHGHHPRR